MIKIDKVHTDGFPAAIRGMRNPMNSWDQSDSVFTDTVYSIGKADKALMLKLAKAGTDHGKYMRYITVTMDVNAPLYWWKEFDTYKVGTVANSCSTMHKIASKPFTEVDFSTEHLSMDNMIVFNYLVEKLNTARRKYLNSEKKEDWWQMIQMLPSSYNQKRTIFLNYAVLRNIYHSRRHHKLDEWREFCRWIESLPCSEIIMEESCTN